MPKSILLIGFPRGFTTVTYDLMARATGFRTAGARAGEVLNALRWDQPGESVPTELEGLGEHAFYNSRPEDYDRFAAILKRFAAADEPYIIKDVVQPFQVLEYLRRNPEDFRVFFVRRDLGEVISRMRRRNWKYIHSLDALEQRMLRFPVIDTRRMMFDETYLFRRLQGLGLAVEAFDYITPDFVARRDATLDEIEADLMPRQASPPESFPQIEIGRTYRFGARPMEPTNRAFLASGWLPMSGLGLWTEGDQASLAFTFPPLPDGGVLRLQLSPFAGIDNAVWLSLRLEGEAEPIERFAPAQAERWISLRLPAAPGPRHGWLRFRPERTVVPARVCKRQLLAACGVSLEAFKLESGA